MRNSGMSACVRSLRTIRHIYKANDTVFLLPPTLRLWTPQISRMQNTYQYIFLYPFINLSYCQEQQLHPWTCLDEEKQMQIVHRCLVFLIPGLTHRPLWLILSLFRLYWMQVFTDYQMRCHVLNLDLGNKDDGEVLDDNQCLSFFNSFI